MELEKTMRAAELYRIYATAKSMVLLLDDIIHDVGGQHQVMIEIARTKTVCPSEVFPDIRRHYQKQMDFAKTEIEKL